MGNIAQINGGGGELPAKLEALQNGRWRLTRSILFSSPANVDDAMFGTLGEALSLEYTTQSDETKFQNMVLVAQEEQSDIVNRASAMVLTKVYETLTGTFVGETDDVTDYEINGLKRVRRTLIAVAGTSTAAYIVGTQSYESEAAVTAGAFVVGRRYKIVSVGSTNFTAIGASANTVGVVFTATGVGSGTGTARYPTLYLAGVRIEENDAFVRVLGEYLEPGIVSTGSRLIDGGLREVTVRSFYDVNAPAMGIVVSQTKDNELGYPVWVTTTLQKADGTSPVSTGAAETFESLGQFLYPGRAVLYNEPLTVGIADFRFYDLFLSPPIESTVDATTEISYSVTADIGTLANPLWNPQDWATLKAQYLVDGNVGGARSKVEGLRGYRVGDPDTPGGTVQTVTATSATDDFVVAFGTLLTDAFPLNAEVSGGPVSPEGNTYTLSYKVDPAFTGTDGTQYYRRTVTYATIPAQPALPV
jgi:hypothetical protein